jgi:ParB-like chromosome segregation protein Spo0J
MLGVKTIKANVVEISDEEMQLRAIVENLQRLDLNPIEEARAFETLIAHGYTIQRVVEELGLKSGSLVKQRLDLLTLTQEIQGLVAHGQLSMNMAWGVALVAPPYQMRLLRDIQSRKLRTVEDVKHAGIAMRDALAQMEIFGDLTVAAPSKQQLAALSKLEAKINAIADMVTRGFKDGHCETARKIAPDRVALMADKLKLIRKHVLEMEHQLRAAAVQGEITLEFEA